MDGLPMRPSVGCLVSTCLTLQKLDDRVVLIYAVFSQLDFKV